MSWYSTYLSIFEKPVEQVPKEVLNEIKGKLKQINSEQPLVSIVLIAHNEATRLLSCIWSLVDNKFDFPIEIIGVNNCSTDKTAEIFDQIGLKWYEEEKPGPGYARQCGLDYAKGKYHLCIDADTIYPPLYIKTMTDALQKPQVVAAFSLWSFIPDERNTRFKLMMYEFLRDIHLKIQSRKRPELSVRGMAFAFKTNLGKSIGFRKDIKRGEDGSLALALKEHGKVILLTSRKARVVTSSGTLNNDGSLLNSFGKRLVKAVKGLSNYFTKETNYKDEDSNLI